jgi:hypothetical protein
MLRGAIYLSHTAAAVAGALLWSQSTAFTTPQVEQGATTMAAESPASPSASIDERALRRIVEASVARALAEHRLDSNSGASTESTVTDEASPRNLQADEEPEEADEERAEAHREAAQAAQRQLDAAVHRGVWTFDDEVAFMNMATGLSNDEVGALLSARTVAVNSGRLSIEPPH